MDHAPQKAAGLHEWHISGTGRELFGRKFETEREKAREKKLCERNFVGMISQDIGHGQGTLTSSRGVNIAEM